MSVKASNIGVMIVDDHDLVRHGFASLLSAQNGIEVVAEAKSGEEALSFVMRQKIDLILLDILLPGMDGFETCRRLREMTEVPILFLTGKAKGKEDIVHGFSLGADDYLTKPFSMRELFFRINAILRRTYNT